MVWTCDLGLSSVCAVSRPGLDLDVHFSVQVSCSEGSWRDSAYGWLIIRFFLLSSPVKAYWVFPPMKEDEHTCIDEGISAVWIGSFNTLADLLITILPIPVILRLQMPRRQRIGVVILLSLGLVVTIAGAFRTYYLWYDLVDTYDITWLSYPLWISATVEVYLGLVRRLHDEFSLQASEKENWFTDKKIQMMYD